MSMIYGVVLAPSMLSIYVIASYWRSLSSIGFAGEVIKRAPNMFMFDLMAIYAAVMVGYWALHAWTGFTLPLFASESMTETGNVLIALVCFFALVLILRFNASDRFTEPTAAGIKEAAVRSLLTLRIIERAEEIFRKEIERRRK